ncbi:hypothetical protein C8J57DRAFT_1470610 [Mycena rebaudengoi]|nr:hypothetical protein C8J57DRAFT_1470610 [Mycena rebaudengoi]
MDWFSPKEGDAGEARLRPTIGHLDRSTVALAEPKNQRTRQHDGYPASCGHPFWSPRANGRTQAAAARHGVACSQRHTTITRNHPANATHSRQLHKRRRVNAAVRRLLMGEVSALAMRRNRRGVEGRWCGMLLAAVGCSAHKLGSTAQPTWIALSGGGHAGRGNGRAQARRLTQVEVGRRRGWRVHECGGDRGTSWTRAQSKPERARTKSVRGAVGAGRRARAVGFGREMTRRGGGEDDVAERVQSMGICRSSVLKNPGPTSGAALGVQGGTIREGGMGSVPRIQIHGTTRPRTRMTGRKWWRRNGFEIMSEPS